MPASLSICFCGSAGDGASPARSLSNAATADSNRTSALRARRRYSSMVASQSRVHGGRNVGRHSSTIASGVYTHPPIVGLAEIAGADSLEQVEIAFIFIAIRRLAARRRLRRDVEQKRQAGGGKILLRIGEPDRIEAERFAVGNAGGAIPIADQDQAALQPLLDFLPALVAVRDVEQLHHVGTIVPLTLQRARDLFPDRRPIVRK